MGSLPNCLRQGKVIGAAGLVPLASRTTPSQLPLRPKFLKEVFVIPGLEIGFGSYFFYDFTCQLRLRFKFLKEAFAILCLETWQLAYFYDLTSQLPLRFKFLKEAFVILGLETAFGISCATSSPVSCG